MFSLLGDLFEPSKRAAVAAVVQLAMGVGLALGQGIAGFVGACAARPTLGRALHCAPAFFHTHTSQHVHVPGSMLSRALASQLGHRLPGQG